MLSSKYRRGFTLIELLVVIAILSLLITLLIPLVGNVLALTRQSVCMNNLHNLHKASTLYQNAYEGANPSAWQGGVWQKGSVWVDWNGVEYPWTEFMTTFTWPAILEKAELYGLSTDMHAKALLHLSCPERAKPPSYIANLKTGTIGKLWAQWFESGYGMVTAGGPESHEFSFAAWRIDRIPKPASLMMLEDLFISTEYWQPRMGLVSDRIKRYGTTSRRGSIWLWKYYGYRDELLPGPHRKRDNIVFFGGNGQTAAPQKIYDDDYWLMAK